MFSGHPPSVKRWTTFTAFSSRTQKGAKIQIRVWAIGNQKKLKTCTTNQGDLCSIYACVLIAFCNILFVSAFHLNITFKFFSVFLPSEFFATYTLKNLPLRERPVWPCSLPILQARKCKLLLLKHLVGANPSSQAVWPNVGVKSSPIVSKSSPIVSKSCPKSGHCSFYKRVRFFNMVQIVANHLSFFCKKFCCQELLKIAQSGHTGLKFDDNEVMN